jgi:hypothetical protein
VRASRLRAHGVRSIEPRASACCVRVRAQELDALATKHSNFKARPHHPAIALSLRIVFVRSQHQLACMRVQVHYTLDRPPAGWSQGVGFISADMVCGGACARAPHARILTPSVFLPPRSRHTCHRQGRARRRADVPS